MEQETLPPEQPTEAVETLKDEHAAELARLVEANDQAGEAQRQAQAALEETAEHQALTEAKASASKAKAALSTYAVYLATLHDLDMAKDGIHRDGTVERATKGGPDVIVFSSRQERARQRALSRNRAQGQ